VDDTQWQEQQQTIQCTPDTVKPAKLNNITNILIVQKYHIW